MELTDHIKLRAVQQKGETNLMLRNLLTLLYISPRHTIVLWQQEKGISSFSEWHPFTKVPKGAFSKAL